jgi:hypothetical protein
MILIYGDALSRIASAESGPFGWWAHEALKEALALRIEERQ